MILAEYTGNFFNLRNSGAAGTLHKQPFDLSLSEFSSLCKWPSKFLTTIRNNFSYITTVQYVLRHDKLCIFGKCLALPWLQDGRDGLSGVSAFPFMSSSVSAFSLTAFSGALPFPFMVFHFT